MSKSKKNTKNNAKSIQIPAAVTEVATAVLTGQDVTEEQITETQVAVAEMAAEHETIVEDVAEPVVEAPQAPKFVVLGKRDYLGYGETTETSWLASAILSGQHTRAELQTAFLARFVPTNAPAEIKRKKTSFSVFLSDVKRPIGTYHASRALTIVVGEDGKMSFDQASYDKAVTAIADGILSDLKGINPKNHATKFAKVQEKFGY